MDPCSSWHLEQSSHICLYIMLPNLEGHGLSSTASFSQRWAPILVCWHHAGHGHTLRKGLLSGVVSVATMVSDLQGCTISQCECWVHGHLSTSVNIQCISQQPHHPGFVCGHGYVLACLEHPVHPMISLNSSCRPASSWLICSMSALCECMYPQ